MKLGFTLMHMSYLIYNFRPEMTKSVAWKDLPETVCIDRNQYDYGETELSLNNSPTLVEDILEIFTKIHKLRNRFTAANAKELFGDLIKHYKALDEVQMNVVLMKWAQDYYVDVSVLKKKMSQSIDDFKDLAITVNDLKEAIEPQYMWIFRKLSNVIGGPEMIKDIQDQILKMFLRCTAMSYFQKLAICELRDHLKTIETVKSEVIFSRYVQYSKSKI